MRVKIAKCFATFALAASMCLAPFSQAAYANAMAVYYVGTALATVLAVLGVSPKVDGNVDFNAIGEAYTSFVDGFAGATADVLKDTVAAWDKTLTEDIDWDNIGTTISASTAELARMGESGVIDLNALSMSGAFGILPALLSLFINDQISISSVSKQIGDYAPVHYKVSGDLGRYDVSSYKLIATNDFQGDVIGLTGDLSTQYCNFRIFDGQWRYCYSSNSIATGNLQVSRQRTDGIWSSLINNVMQIADMSLRSLSTGTWTILSSLQLRFWIDKSTYVILDAATGTIVENNTGLSVTDNPDVNLGHDYWDDAKDRVDVLNPSAGASIIGADAVIDGDYIVNRGSLGVITDWADINSWADALARAHAGVAEGALDGTISGTATGTAVNVGTGELVTDAVGELVKPDAGTSVSPSKDFDWGKFLDPSLYLVFPFCLPWDLVELVKTLSAEPQAPVIDWPMPTLTGQQNLHVDLSPWSPVAAVLRAGELVVAAVGLIWITKTMIRN